MFCPLWDVDKTKLALYPQTSITHSWALPKVRVVNEYFYHNDILSDT